MNSYKDNFAHPTDSNPIWGMLEKQYNENFVKVKIIPKLIHQVWLGGSLPEKYLNLVHSWQELHPDWTYKLWTDDDINSFELFNRKLFDAMDNLGAKSDIFRYEIIYRYGGLYVDTDFQCVRSFNDFLHLNFFSGGGPAKVPHTFNGLFGAKPYHPILKTIIDVLSKTKLAKEDDFTQIMKLTGPDFFSKVVLDHISKYEKIVVFPENFFYPFPMELRFDKAVRDVTDLSVSLSYVKENTYAVHLWHTAWQEDRAVRTNVAPVKQKNKWFLKVPKILHVYWGGHTSGI
jgi:mannosyltransferase OCH1-like enzyme